MLKDNFLSQFFIPAYLHKFGKKQQILRYTKLVDKEARTPCCVWTQSQLFRHWPQTFPKEGTPLWLEIIYKC